MDIKITEEQLDILREIINIGVGKAASTLNSLLGSHIKLMIPYVKLIKFNEIQKEIEGNESDNLASLNLKFKGNFSGSAKLIFPTDGASKLVRAFAEEDDDEEDLDEIRSGTLSEIGNIVLNALMGTLSNLLRQHLVYSPPSYIEGELDKLLHADKFDLDSVNIFARTRFVIQDIEIVGDFVLFFEVGSLTTLITIIDSYGEEDL
jgi:chemotaxis protein CheC